MAATDACSGSNKRVRSAARERHAKRGKRYRDTHSAFIPRKYADHVLHKKYIYVVEIITPLGEGRRKRQEEEESILDSHACVHRPLLSRLRSGRRQPHSHIGTSDYEATESFIDAATGPITLNILEIEQPTNWTRPGGEFFKHWIDLSTIGCDKFREHILPILEKMQVRSSERRETVSENYKTPCPCFINAMQHVGVDEAVVERHFMVVMKHQTSFHAVQSVRRARVYKSILENIEAC